MSDKQYIDFIRQFTVWCYDQKKKNLDYPYTLLFIAERLLKNAKPD